MPEGEFKFLGDEHGQLLEADQLAGKLDEAAQRFNSITDPDTAHDAVQGLSYADVVMVLQNRQVTHHNVFRLLGAEPLWSVSAGGQAIVEASTKAIAGDTETIPDDIAMMVQPRLAKLMIA